MLKKISFALVAASLIAGPALAQGTNATVSAPSKTQVTTPAASVKTETKADVKSGATTDVKASAKADKKSEAVQLKKKHVRHVTKHKKVAAKSSAKVRVTN